MLAVYCVVRGAWLGEWREREESEMKLVNFDVESPRNANFIKSAGQAQTLLHFLLQNNTLQYVIQIYDE